MRCFPIRSTLAIFVSIGARFGLEGCVLSLSLNALTLIKSNDAENDAKGIQWLLTKKGVQGKTWEARVKCQTLCELSKKERPKPETRGAKLQNTHQLQLKVNIDWRSVSLSREEVEISTVY